MHLYNIETRSNDSVAFFGDIKAIALSIVTLVLQQLNLANVIYVKVLHININLKRKEMNFDILKEVLYYSFFVFLGSIGKSIK